MNKVNLNFRNVNVLVIGDLILDKYLIGNSTRNSPEANVPIVKLSKEELSIGGAANVANNIKGLQANVFLIGVVGNDSSGRNLIRIIENRQIDNYIIKLKQKTITKVRIISSDKHILRFDVGDLVSLSKTQLDELSTCLQDKIPKTDIVIISDYDYDFIDRRLSQSVMDLANIHNKKVIVDSKKNNWKLFYGAFMITPNINELSKILNVELQNTNEEIEKYCMNLLEIYNIKNLLVTRSENGISLISNFFIKHFQSYAKNIIDVCGAGDTVIATLSVSIANCNKLIDSIQLASKSASIVIKYRNTNAITLGELIYEVNKNNLKKPLNIQVQQ